MTKSLNNEDFDWKKPRVLVVENNLRTAWLHKQNLERWGYQPILAEGAGEVLLADAERKAYDYACHIAIVDMRLMDDYDNNDKSGLDLAPKLKPSLSIIVSGSGNDRKTALEAIRKNAFDFIGKEEPLPRLQSSLECASKQMFCGKNGPAMLISDDLAQYIMSSLAPKKPDQVRELLKSLFPKAKKISVENMDGSTRTPSLPQRRRSIVIRVTTDDHQPVVVKLSSRTRGKASKVAKEERNFRKYVEDQMPNHFYARIRTSQPKWHISGIVYDFLGAGQENFTLFSQYYRDQPIENIQQALEHLFRDTWGERYRKTQAVPSRPQSLFNLYAQVWEKGKWLRSVLAYLNEKPKRVEFKFASTKLDDPVHWVKHKTHGGENLTEDKSYLPHLQVAVTHGDLLGDNFFVDEDRHSWTIDYERTGVGHILQDFVQLELDILVRIAGFHENETDDFVAMFLDLIKADTIEMEHNGSNLPRNGRVQKAHATIRILRQRASEFVMNGDWRVYYWGLLLNAVFRTILLEEKIQQNQTSDTTELRFEQQLALMVGALLCLRLDHWGNSWPLADLLKNHSNLNSVKELKDSKVQSTHKPSGPIAVLFLAANPDDTVRFKFDEEVRRIDEAIGKTNLREQIVVKPHFAVRIEDLSALLLRHQPTIVHFSGHGSATGEIILHDESSMAHAVSARALGKLFEVLKDNIRCVVLNACFSSVQAEAIAQHVDVVIGMSTAIGDEAALKFSAGFYQSLGYGRNLDDAFKLGCSSIDLSGISEENSPKMIALRIDPRTIYLHK